MFRAEVFYDLSFLLTYLIKIFCMTSYLKFIGKVPRWSYRNFTATASLSVGGIPWASTNHMSSLNHGHPVQSFQPICVADTLFHRFLLCDVNIFITLWKNMGLTARQSLSSLLLFI